MRLWLNSWRTWKRDRRRLLIERLEARQTMSYSIPGFAPDGPVDDFESIKGDSLENTLSVTRNDYYWHDRWNSLLVDSTHRSDILPVVASLAVGANTFDASYPLSYTPRKILSVTAPKHGTARVSEDKLSVIYTPERGYEGVDQFDYFVEGAISDRNSATVHINVVQPLLAVDDWFLSKPSTATLNLDVLKNDQFNVASFLDDELRRQFKIVSVTNPTQGGSVRIADDGRSLVYSAASGYEGIEKLEYTIEDSEGYFDTAEVTIRVSQSTTASETIWPEQLQQQWLEEIVARNLNQFGQGLGTWGRFPFPLITFDQVASPTIAANTASSNQSRTNNQVEGVDEGDLVETDGRYLYVFTRHLSYEGTPLHADSASQKGVSFLGGYYSPGNESSSLVIIDTIDPQAPKVVSELNISGRLIGQHVSGNRLVVLTESYGDGVTSTMTIVDITDQAVPKVVRSTSFDGNVAQSRLIEDKLYVFATSYIQVPLAKLHEVQDGNAAFYETGRQFLTRLGSDLFGSAQILVTNFDGTGKIIGEPTKALTPSETLDIVRGTGVAAGIFSFDIDASQAGPFDIDLFQSDYAPTVYVSSNSAYFFTTRWDLNDGIGGSTQVSSYVFDRNDGTVAFSAKGSLAGSLLNSFSAAEYNGDLQVFTSVGLDGTQLSILRRDGVTLKEIGSVKKIAPGEQVYSARFAGDRAFAVTFRRVDPLFVFDLSNPTDPKIEGELKLPGYSQYLHIIDSSHLMGIGRDADENTGLFSALQVSLFDVSDTKNPMLKSSYQFAGGRQTFSPLVASAFGLTDHHALGYSATSGILALPLTNYDDWFGDRNGDGSPKDDNRPEVGVLKIDTLNGITDLGGVQSPSPIYRTVQLGQYLYSIAQDRIIVTGLLTPSLQVAELLLPQPTPPVNSDPPKNDGNGETMVIVSIKTTGTNDVPVNTGTTKRQWHNRDNPYDVNGDGSIAPLDVLNVINFLKARGSVAIAEVEKDMATGQAAQIQSASTFFQVDVNGDGEVSPLDVLLVINRLRRDSAPQSEGEGTNPTVIDLTDVAFASTDASEWSVPDIERDERDQALR